MPEERLGQVIEASETERSPGAIGSPTDKMRVHELRGPRRTTTGPTSADVVTKGERPEVRWEPRRRTNHPDNVEKYRVYRRICDALAAEIRNADRFLADGEMTDEGLEIVAEVEAILDRLYGCEWGEKEYLKRVVVAVCSQVNNAKWTAAHVGFLKEIARELRTAYLVDEQLIRRCFDLMLAHGLDPFRGSVSSSGFQKQYRIEEVK